MSSPSSRARHTATVARAAGARTRTTSASPAPTTRISRFRSRSLSPSRSPDMAYEPEVNGEALPPEVEAAVARLDELVQQFEAYPEFKVQSSVFELLQCVDTIHRAGMQRLGELLKV